MFEAVHAAPEGHSTVARLAATAADYGFEGVVVRNHADAQAAYDDEAIRERYGVDVASGVEIRARDPAKAGGYVGTHRPKTTIVCVHGGSRAINRFAVEQERVDVLCHPMRDGGDVNHVVVRAAADNDVRLELNLGGVLRGAAGRGARVREIAAARKLWELIEAFDAPFVVSADPASHLELRGPRELAAVGEVIGIEPSAVESGLAEWGRLAQRNRERLSDEYVAPGVRRGRYAGADTDDDGGTEEP